MTMETLPRVRNQDLPPVAAVPILREYGRLGLSRFHDIYGMPAFTDDRGFIDYNTTLDYINSHVKDDYHWQGELEVHHLLYEASQYSPNNFDASDVDADGEDIDPELPKRVRENVFNKIVIPDDLHDLWHVLMVPQENPPDYMSLKQRDRGAHIAMSLFQHAKQAIDIEQREKSFTQMNHPRFADRLIDQRTRRVIGREVLLDRYIEFNIKFHNHLASVDSQEVAAFITPDALESNDPLQSVVHDMNSRFHLSSGKRGIKAKLRSRHASAA